MDSKINIEVVFEGSENNYPKISELINSYLDTYYKIKNEYKLFYKEGTGYKTNSYHEPVMNYAYNYIQHNNFKKIAKESPRGYNRNGSYKGSPISYEYYMALWSITCEELEKKYGNKFIIKFDHRHKDNKNNDFDGILYCFSNFKFWKNRNLPHNQKYK